MERLISTLGAKPPPDDNLNDPALLPEDAPEETIEDEGVFIPTFEETQYGIKDFNGRMRHQQIMRDLEGHRIPGHAAPLIGAL